MTGSLSILGSCTPCVSLDVNWLFNFIQCLLVVVAFVVTHVTKNEVFI